MPSWFWVLAAPWAGQALPLRYSLHLRQPIVSADTALRYTLLMESGIQLRQPVEGYRYAIDPFLLADNIAADNAHRIADLGTGNGILPMLLSKLWPDADFWGLDIQREPLICAVQNCRRLGLRSTFIQSDVRQASSLLKAESFDLAVSNPPYRKAGSGRINPVSAKAVARHELKLTLAELVRAASHLLADGGQFSVIHLAGRSAELLHTLMEQRLTPHTVRFIHSRSDEEAVWVTVNAIKNGRNDVTVRPPFIVYAANGDYSIEMKSIYERFDV